MLLFRSTENGYVLFFAFRKLLLGLFRVILLFFCLDLRVKGPLEVGLDKARHIVYKVLSCTLCVADILSFIVICRHACESFLIGDRSGII